MKIDHNVLLMITEDLSSQMFEFVKFVSIWQPFEVLAGLNFVNVITPYSFNGIEIYLVGAYSTL
jgi:hypothetical protein